MKRNMSYTIYHIRYAVDSPFNEISMIDGTITATRNNADTNSECYKHGRIDMTLGMSINMHV